MHTVIKKEHYIAKDYARDTKPSSHSKTPDPSPAEPFLHIF